MVTRSGVVVSKWIDSKEVVVVSNCSLPETTSISRKQKDGTRKQFQCPDAIALYNDIMGGVDLSDQKVNVYNFNRKSTKWWKKVFYKIKTARVKRKTNIIAGPRSKRTKAFFNVGNHLPVESQGRR